MFDQLEKMIKEIEIPEDNLGIIFGIHFGANEETVNGRIYENKTWQDVIKLLYDPKYIWNIPNGKVLGQIGHHSGRPGIDALYAGKISHRTAAMWMEGDTGYAISIVGDNEEGRKLKSYYDMGICLYPSSRGRLARKSKVVTSDIYTFFGFDYVFEPSLPSSKIIFISMKQLLELKDGLIESESLKHKGE